MEHNNNEETVLLRTFTDLALAAVAVDKLRESGITASMVDRNVAGLTPLDGVEVRVFAKDAEAAAALIDGIN